MTFNSLDELERWLNSVTERLKASQLNTGVNVTSAGVADAQRPVDVARNAVISDIARPTPVAGPASTMVAAKVAMAATSHGPQASMSDKGTIGIDLSNNLHGLLDDQRQNVPAVQSAATPEVVEAARKLVEDLLRP